MATTRPTTTRPATKDDPARAAWLLACRELLLFGALVAVAIGFSLLL